MDARTAGGYAVAMPTQRQALVADIAALWELRTRAVRVSCASHYAPEVIEAWCAAAPPDRLPRLPETGELDAAFVDPAEQGRGIAGRLLAALDAMARERGLHRLFLSASLNALPFYERAGYVAVRRETYPHRSGIGLESVFMEKTLPCA